MIDHPLVSILIPVFNREQYIAECIESALAQSYPQFEIVIVDNASTDQTAKICRDYASRHSKIRFYENTNNIGPVRNWQRCAQEARGNLVKILFSDDLLLTSCLQEMVGKLTKDVAFVYGACLVGDDIDRSRLRYNAAGDAQLTQAQFINALVNGDAPISPGAILLRTADLRENLHTNFMSSTPQEFDRYGAGPDVMISLLTSERYLSICALAQPLIFFRVHSGSFTLQNTGNAVQDCYRSVLSLYLKKKYGFDAWARYLALQWIAQIIKERKITNPRRFIQRYEGSGTLTEVNGFGRQLLGHTAQKILFREKFVVVDGLVTSPKT
jgi:glycosyltransferase involved in cell wall biosynthesis